MALDDRIKIALDRKYGNRRPLRTVYYVADNDTIVERKPRSGEWYEVNPMKDSHELINAEVEELIEESYSALLTAIFLSHNKFFPAMAPDAHYSLLNAVENEVENIYTNIEGIVDPRMEVDDVSNWSKAERDKLIRDTLTQLRKKHG